MTVGQRPPQKQAVVWADPNSKEGAKAAALLRRAGAKVEVREVGTKNWKQSDAAAAVPGYTSLPQVVVDNAVIGDFAALKAHSDFGAKLKKPKLSKDARMAKAAEHLAALKSNRATARAARVAAEASVVKGRINHATPDQKTAAIARAEAAKTARVAQHEARVARVNAVKRG